MLPMAFTLSASSSDSWCWSHSWTGTWPRGFHGPSRSQSAMRLSPSCQRKHHRLGAWNFQQRTCHQQGCVTTNGKRTELEACSGNKAHSPGIGRTDPLEEERLSCGWPLQSSFNTWAGRLKEWPMSGVKLAAKIRLRPTTQPRWGGPLSKPLSCSSSVPPAQCC